MDLVELIGNQVSLVLVDANPKHYRGDCPLCGTHQTLCVYSNQAKPKWFCHYCKQSGDGIDWLRLQGMSYRQACAVVRGKDHKAFFFNQASKAVKSWEPNQVMTPCRRWQKRMTGFVQWSQGNLSGAPMEYLHGRGIDGATAKRFGLGYNPQRWSLPAGGFGLTDKQTIVIDQGIVIPTWRNGSLQAVKIRLDKPWRNGAHATRYHILAGSRPAAMILENGKDACLVMESELDLAMLVSIGLRSFNLVAIGAAGSKPDKELDCMLGTSKRILVALDSDRAGNLSAQWWIKHYPQAIRLQPVGKDIGAMFTAGGPDNVLSWIQTRHKNTQAAHKPF